MQAGPQPASTRRARSAPSQPLLSTDFQLQCAYKTCGQLARTSSELDSFLAAGLAAGFSSSSSEEDSSSLLSSSLLLSFFLAAACGGVAQGAVRRG